MVVSSGKVRLTVWVSRKSLNNIILDLNPDYIKVIGIQMQIFHKQL